jgi:hypothetical protein
VKTVLAARAVYAWLYAGEPLRVDPARPLAGPEPGVAF